MPTVNQLSRGARKPQNKISRVCLAFGATGTPHRKGIIYKLAIMTPRKPNSARRKIAKVRLCYNNKRVFTHIPGENHKLYVHATVLVEGGGAKDLPGVNCSLIRGLKDFLPEAGRTRRRSKFGVKKPKSHDDSDDDENISPKL